MKIYPIGLAKIELVKRQDNILIVQGLDALEGSPILDIKPF
jgi:tRNA (Thr-GGU) A37 N-methylase